VIVIKPKKIINFIKLHPLRTSFYFAFFSGAFLFHTLFIKDLPNPFLLQFEQPSASTRIYDRHGRLLYKIFQDENRTLLSLKNVPEYVQQATISIEDQGFYKHRGLSLRGVVRAARHDFLKKRGEEESSLQGGSTITQQLVKNALLSPERTVTRKVKEFLLASAVELIFDKQQILNMYLNHVAYGGTAYGIEEAAQMYFGKSAQHLNLAEASLLAGLPASPTTYSPFGSNPHLAKERQRLVLQRMVKDGYITQQQADQAQKEVLAFSPKITNIKAPHFVLYIKEQLAQKYGQEIVEKGGLQVYTTLDLDVQQIAQEKVKKNVLESRDRYNLNNGAALVTKPNTGEIIAMVGSVDFWDFENDGNVNLTTSLRQPGSSIKIVNYAYALENGGYTPSSMINDSPITFTDEWGNSYRPVNYDHKFKGPVTLRVALAESRNIPAVKVLASYGVEKMIEQARKMGITSWNEPEKYGLALTLGSAETKMTDMGVVFGTVANMGKKKQLVGIKKIVDSNGNIIQDINKPKKLWAKIARDAYADDDSFSEGRQVLSPFTAWQIKDILADKNARAGEFGLRTPLRVVVNDQDREVFVKTGTSNDFKDNWTDGCSPDYCVLTWVGNNDGQPMNQIASGITGAAPIWNQIITELLANQEPKNFHQPEGMIEVEVCAVNGLLPCKGCPETKKALFVPGTEPVKHCHFPSPEECQAKKKKMEEEGKPAEEIVKALRGCPLQ